MNADRPGPAASAAARAAFLMHATPAAALLLAALAASLGCGDDAGAATGVAGTGGGPTTGPTSAATGSGEPPCPGATDHAGDATWYDADGAGNCSFPATPDDLLVVALNHADYADAAFCGACVAVDGPDGSVTVRVVDQCPRCSAGDLDLSPEAFARLAPLEAGRVDVAWRYVPCDVVGPIVYHFKEGSNPYWLAVQVRNHRQAVATVEARGDDDAWRPLERVDYNFFLADPGLGPGPFAFRVTDVEGGVLEDDEVPLVEAGDAPGAAQFSRCGDP